MKIANMTEIERFNPCKEAIEFRNMYPSFEEAWNACPRGDWMLWIAKRVGVDIETLTKAKANCALTVRPLMKDQRSISACEVAIRFSEGKATRLELDAAAADAYAAYAYAYAPAAYAAYAAAADADAAYAPAAYAADDAAAAHAAAAAAAYAAYAADADAAYADAAYAAAADADAAAAAAAYADRKATADICRQILTEQVLTLIKS